MGTHPIFESDFDCLTVLRNLEKCSDKLLHVPWHHLLAAPASLSTATRPSPTRRLPSSGRPRILNASKRLKTSTQSDTRIARRLCPFWTLPSASTAAGCPSL